MEQHRLQSGMIYSLISVLNDEKDSKKKLSIIDIQSRVKKYKNFFCAFSWGNIWDGSLMMWFCQDDQ